MRECVDLYTGGSGEMIDQMRNCDDGYAGAGTDKIHAFIL
jgi:hypothetical protein